MDEETREAFNRLMVMINNGNERILDKLDTLSTDFRNTKDYLIKDALIQGKRIDKIEDKLDE